MKVTPYLHFDGQCEEAFRTYERVLGGKLAAIFTYGDSPMASMYPAMAKKVMHARVDIGDQQILGSDAPPDRLEKVQGFSVCLDLNDTPEAERVFRELSEGGTVEMPLQETFWSKRFAMFVDRFGTPWMINVASAAYAAA